MNLAILLLLFYHSESATNYINEGFTGVFYIGTEDTMIDINILLGASSYIINIDTTNLEHTELSEEELVELDTIVTLDSLIEGYFVTTDTLHLNHTESSYFIATDTTAYYIPQGDNKAFRIYGIYDTLNLNNLDTSSMSRIALTSLMDLNHGAIKIYLGGEPKEVQQDLFGFTLEGHFLPKHLPKDDVLSVGATNPEAWNWLADLKPQTLRFPGGASGKFMHLLPYDTDGDNENDKFPVGYGYDIIEIIKYYDQTDGAINVNCLGCDYTNAQVKADLADDDADDNGSIWETCEDWMNKKYDADISSFYDKWDSQKDLTGDDKLYIDQFIELVNIIEVANNYKVNVIFDLNILSSSASQCAEIVNYMRDEELNEVTDINIVGVEMGNECYFKWLFDLMRIEDFTEYWNYLNGAGSPSVTLSAGVPSWVASDHNYFNTFRSGLFATNPVKIGIPAETPGESDGGVVVTSEWNNDLRAKIENDIENDKFDAVIIHNYFDAQKYWQDIPQDHLCLKYPNDGYPGCSVNPCIAAPGVYPKWRYDTYDERLRDAFDGFLGVNSNLDGSVRKFIKSNYYDDFNVIKSQLSLGIQYPELTTHGIEIWNTEKNLKDQLYIENPETDPGIIGEMQNLNAIYNNSFGHGLLMQEWLLNDIKLNFTEEFGENFITYGHYHNFAGGGWTCMLSSADYGDFVNHVDEYGIDMPISPSLYSDKLYYMRRTTYWTMMLLSEINKNNLEYLPSNITMRENNPNVSPTIFVDPNNYVYVYYSNMKNVPQDYVIYPNDIEGLFGGNRDFETLISRGIFKIEVDFNYMSSGKNTLFHDSDPQSVNNCYSKSLSNAHPFHIFGITEDVLDLEKTGPYPSVFKVSAPANSFGYFKLEIQWGPAYITRESDLNKLNNVISLSPNPTGGKFKILSQNIISLSDSEIKVEVKNLAGVVIYTELSTFDKYIDITNLPSGLYLVTITNSSKSINSTKQLVKIN